MPVTNQPLTTEARQQRIAQYQQRIQILKTAFDSLPENGAGSAYGEILEEIYDLKFRIRQLSI
ncbi:MAG: hypothetical protein HC924_17065 [Synechococcaceae cyanobacterium SM2_3_2]|nr:hypothetical protein [Synechococcaceae cyanobacterium SM2_3_2]